MQPNIIKFCTVDIALGGIWGSVKHMDGSAKMF